MPNSKQDGISYREFVKEIQALEDKVDRTYLKLTEFEPVKKIVYGLVSLTLVSVFGAVLALVVTK